MSAPDTPDTPDPSEPRAARRRRLHHLLTVPLVGAIGALLGLMLVPATTVDVGPLKATVHVQPSLASNTVIMVPPVGEITFRTHRAPVQVEARVKQVDVRAAEQILYDDAALAELQRTAPDRITSAAVRNVGLNALFAGLGAVLAVGLTYRRVRRTVVAGGTALVVVVGTAGLMAATFRPQALYQPQFDGLLSQAAGLVDVTQYTVADYANYRSILAEFVSQVSALYVAAGTLPSAQGPQGEVITVLHVSDIHDNPQSFDMIAALDEQFDLDMVIDTGDIVSWGTPYEDRIIAQLGSVDVPYVFVSGNHDGQGAISTVAAQPNGIVLENEIVEVEGLVIAGVGDPRFAADDDSMTTGWQRGKDSVRNAGYQLGDTIEAWNEENPDNPVDVALIHDPTEPDGLLGRTPLVLTGHMHTSTIDMNRDGSGSDWLTVGSSGGALASGGVLRVLDGEDPLELESRLLYFDAETGDLVAYDDITMGGLGLVSVSIQRHQFVPTDHALEIPEGLETPESPIPTEDEISPGQNPPDEERITPESPSDPAPETTEPDPTGDAEQTGEPEDPAQDTEEP
ncbi:MAG: metallophosphoesterase [Brachybacterium sp.]|nr:metallophosphoesterase [Brachybacterium sp.]